MSELIDSQEVDTSAFTGSEVVNLDFSLPVGFASFTFSMYVDDDGTGAANAVSVEPFWEIGGSFVAEDPPGGSLDVNINADKVSIVTVEYHARGVRLTATMGLTPPTRRLLVELHGARAN